MESCQKYKKNKTLIRHALFSLYIVSIINVYDYKKTTSENPIDPTLINFISSLLFCFNKIHKKTTEMDHEHTLQKMSPGAPYTCSGCRQLGFGSSYHCQNNSCNYVLHEECAKPDPYGFHRLLENSYFEFHKKPPGDRERYCDACAKDISGFVYHCSRTGYDLHPCCLKLENEITDENVTLKLSNEVHSKCVKCKQKSVVGKVKGWCYYDGDSCYHVSCFKDLILDNWRRGYFSQEERSIASSSSSTSSSRETQLALTSMEMNKKLKISSRGSTIRKYTRKIAVVVFKLIFSAIFGNPISAIAAVLEALASD